MGKGEGRGKGRERGGGKGKGKYLPDQCQTASGAPVLHLVQRGGDWTAPSPPRPLLAVPNVTAHQSTASVPASGL